MRKIKIIFFMLLASLILLGCDNTETTTIPVTEQVTEPVTTVQIIEEDIIHTVEFLDFDETVINTLEVHDGANLINIPSPIREGYTFIGWNYDLSNVRTDITVTAIYEINQYTVTFIGMDDELISTQSVDYNQSPLAPTPPNIEGYTFDSWDVDFSHVTEDLVVTAIYNINKYSVTFEENGGTNVIDFEADYGFTIDFTEVIPEKTDYNFLGWEIDGIPISGETTIIEDIQLVAIWESSMEDFTYITITGGIQITGYTGSNTVVVIPDTFEGEPIIEINTNAFQYNNYIEEVYIGSNIETIGTNAFYRCVNLKNVVLDELTSLKYISTRAFAYCYSLRNINLEVVKGELNIYMMAFHECLHLKRIFIPETTIYVGPNAFTECGKLIIYLGNDISQGLWDSSWNFDNNQTITDVLSYGVIDDLMYVNVDAFGVLIIGLIEGSDVLDIVIPEYIEDEEVKAIYREAFKFTNITSVYIPKTVGIIFDNAFENCLDLETVTFEDSILLYEIENYAFYNCHKLSSINLEASPVLELIERSAFENCNLDLVIIPLYTVTIDSKAFFGNGDLTVYCEALELPIDFDFTWVESTTLVYYGYVVE